MNVIKYIGNGPNKKYNVGQALLDGWGITWSGEKELEGLRLQDRKNKKHKVTIKKADWQIGTLTVWFVEGGWLCLDHAIQQFECVQ